jgi:hypothetical protein
MKNNIVFICLLALTSISNAELLSGQLTLKTGQLLLNNQNAQTIALTNNSVHVEIDSASILASPLKWFRGDNVVKIIDQQNTYSFLVPKDLINSIGEFSVHQKTSKQSAHIYSKIVSTNQTKSTVQKTIACSVTNLTPVVVNTVNPSNGQMSTSVQIQNHLIPGVQEARVLESKWQEQTTIYIYTDSARAEIKTDLISRSKSTTLELLTVCK